MFILSFAGPGGLFAAPTIKYPINTQQELDEIDRASVHDRLFNNDIILRTAIQDIQLQIMVINKFIETNHKGYKPFAPIETDDLQLRFWKWSYF